jgi:hypothetical protein
MKDKKQQLIDAWDSYFFHMDYIEHLEAAPVQDTKKIERQQRALKLSSELAQYLDGQIKRDESDITIKIANIKNVTESGRYGNNDLARWQKEQSLSNLQ